MKFFYITAVAALVASAAAQGLSDLPSCAKTCVANALPKACGLDISCICKTKSFINEMACCVQPKCSQADQKKTIEVAKEICKTGGVTDIPDKVVCDKGTSGSSTATETTSSSTTATGSETTGSSTSNSTGNSTGNSTMAQTAASSTSGSSTATGTTSASAKATSNVAMLGQNKDGSLMAAAGAAAAFAILV